MLVHALPGGGYARCRATKEPCPYGGPVGQTLTRQRLNSDGEVSPKPASDLPFVTVGYGANEGAMKARAESTGVLREVPEAAQRPAPPRTAPVSWMTEQQWSSLSNKEKARSIDEEAQRIADSLGIGWVDEGWKTTTSADTGTMTLDNSTKTLTVSERFLMFSNVEEVFSKLTAVLKQLFWKREGR